jgi:hypothetical protein
VEAPVDRLGRQAEEQPAQRFAISFLESGEPDMACRRRLHRDHLRASSPNPPDIT